MLSQRRRFSALAVSSVFIVTQVFAITSSARPAEARARFDWASQPAPLQLTPRRSPPPRLAPTRLQLSPLGEVRRAHGVRLDGPHMLRPAELDRIANATPSLRGLPSSSFRTPKPVAAAPVPVRRTQMMTVICPSGIGTSTLVSGAATVRRAQAVQPPGATPPPTATPCPDTPQHTPPPATPSPMPMEGTGVKRWWTFRDTDVPGAAHVRANMNTGNVLLQMTDMSVPHKGVALDMVRTYNSESIHDVNGTDGGPPALYGNGWTNNYDMHLAGGDAAGMITVYDADGARYDFTGSNAGGWTPPTGVAASRLSFDGACGYVWKMPAGLKVYFYRPDYASTCGPASAGYAGRLYQILGPNRNTAVTLSYAWDGGIATAAGKISQIVAQTESGLTATLNFGDVGANRVLYQLIRPDNTLVSYNINGNGSLLSVTHPANNAAGTPRYERYTFVQQPGGALVLNVAAGARAAGSYLASGGTQTDGAYLQFAFSVGATNELTRLTEVDHIGFMNPNLGAAGQTYSSSVPTGVTVYLREYYNPTPPDVHANSDYVSDSFSDTDGHSASYVVDGLYRSKTIVRAVGTQTLNWGTLWDSSNDMIATIDPRGQETDYFYDNTNDVTAIAQPDRDTQLFDYDAFGNVTAYCDATETHAAGADWSASGWTGNSPPQYTPGSSTLCSTYAGAVPHWTATYTYPSYQPRGQLASITSPTGYVRTVTYDPANQGGLDFGLPTQISGQSYTQQDNTARTPAQRLVYDSHGNVVCSSADASDASTTTVFVRDSMNRLTAVGDPDDSSLTTPANCQKTSSLPGGAHAIVSRTTYYADGTVQTTQSPDEAAANVSTQHAYDLDGDETAVTANYGNVTSTTTKYFDGADRLVAVFRPLSQTAGGGPRVWRAQLPTDELWYVRYLYDLSGGATVTTLGGQTLTAHGNLYEVTKTAGGGYAQLDLRMSAYDTLDRVTTAYAFAPCPNTGQSGSIVCGNAPYATSYVYDAGMWTMGFLAAQTDALGETKTFAYDQDGRTAAVQYSGDGGVTPAMSYAYDPDGRLVASGAAGVGTQYYTYGPGGILSSSAEPSLTGTYNHVTYAYYPDFTLSSVTTPGSPDSFAYSYRNDGALSHENFAVTGSSAGTVGYGYSGGGRLTAMWDFGSAPSRTQQYDANGRVASYTIPSGTYNNVTYDAEGDVAGYTGYGGVTVSNLWNNRGEQLAENFAPNPVVNNFSAWPSFQWDSYQGMLEHPVNSAYDARTGAPLSIDSGTFTYDAVGRVSQAVNGATSSTFRYDAENRLISGSAEAILDTGTCGSGLGAPSASQNLGYTYDPDGNIAQDVFLDAAQTHHTRQWHWAQNTLLYTVTDGYQDAVNADGKGVLPSGGAAPGLTLYDNELNGLSASAHNVTGHAAWTAPNPYQEPCVSQNPPPASPGYVSPVVGVQVQMGGASNDGNNVTESSTGRSVMPTSASYLVPAVQSGRPYAMRRLADSSRSTTDCGWQGFGSDGKPIPDDGASWSCGGGFEGLGLNTPIDNPYGGAGRTYAPKEKSKPKAAPNFVENCVYDMTGLVNAGMSATASATDLSGNDLRISGTGTLSGYGGSSSYPAYQGFAFDKERADGVISPVSVVGAVILAHKANIPKTGAWTVLGIYVLAGLKDPCPLPAWATP